MSMSDYSIQLTDQDGEITLTRQDLLNYTGPANVIAAALMIRVCHHAFGLLSPGQPVRRRQLYWTLGFPGPGLVDCVEMISHAVREGRCLQKPVTDHPYAPMSLGGQFLFDIAYQGKCLRLWPSPAIFDDEFRENVRHWQEQPASVERDAYLHYKARKVEQLLKTPAEALFEVQWL